MISGGGFDSLTPKHDLAQEIAKSNRPVRLLHVGDYDPSGVHLFSALDEDVRGFLTRLNPDARVASERVAILPEHVERFQLQPAPAKAGWPSMPSSDAFRAFRSTAGEKMVLEDNMFIEAVFPAGMIRKLSKEEMAEYRRPGTGFLVPPPTCNAPDGTSHADQLRDVARVPTVSLHRHDLETVTRAASPASFMPPYSHLR